MTPQISKDLLPEQLWNYKLVYLVPWQNAVSVTSLRHQYDVIFVTSYLRRHWYMRMADMAGVCHAPPNVQ